MAMSEHLKDLKAVWGDSCQSMWAELLSITIADSTLRARYIDLPPKMLVSDMFYAPAVRGRLNDVTADKFIERAEKYKAAVITNRIVILSSAFEMYFGNFLDAYISSRPNLFDAAARSRTAKGDKLYGEVMKIRGLSERIKKFSEEAPSKIKSIINDFPYLDDVYAMRNVLAHRAGVVDSRASCNFNHVSFDVGEHIRISTDKLIELASHVIKIAESLDSKITPR
jgi:hypothetical protein